MRPWLEKQIESQTVPGLRWLDKEKSTFSIPWKHAARHGWELHKDASLFKLWAIHTGKYVEGQTCDPKTWKANFRCAMNSLPDIEEVKDKSINKGHQAMRVFRMLPPTPKSRDKRSKAKDTKMRKKSSVVKTEHDMEDYSDTQSSTDESVPEDRLSPQENVVDSTVNTEHTDFKYVDPSEVPDCSSSVDVHTDNILGNLYHRFEVSPTHSNDLSDSDYNDEIIQICQQLEKESKWLLGPSDSNGFLSNDECTSPWSHWSDSSDDVEIRQYTTLGLDSANHTDDIWSTFSTSFSL